MTSKHNITEQLAEMLKRNPHLKINGLQAKTDKPKPTRAPSHTPGVMNKTEARFADILAMRKRQGEIKDFGFELYTLKLAYRMTFNPDFFVVTLEGAVEFHEVKGGFIREDSWLKLKMAAEKFPQHDFYLDQWKDGKWTSKKVRTL